MLWPEGERHQGAASSTEERNVEEPTTVRSDDDGGPFHDVHGVLVGPPGENDREEVPAWVGCDHILKE